MILKSLRRSTEYSDRVSFWIDDRYCIKYTYIHVSIHDRNLMIKRGILIALTTVAAILAPSVVSAQTKPNVIPTIEFASDAR
jgi:hypothetical protein